MCDVWASAWRTEHEKHEQTYGSKKTNPKNPKKTINIKNNLGVPGCFLVCAMMYYMFYCFSKSSYDRMMKMMMIMMTSLNSDASASTVIVHMIYCSSSIEYSAYEYMNLCIYSTSQ